MVDWSQIAASAVVGQVAAQLFRVALEGRTTAEQSEFTDFAAATADVDGLELPDGLADDLVLLGQGELSDIESFFQSSRVTTLLHSYGIWLIANSRERGGGDELDLTSGAAFCDLARSWCRKQRGSETWEAAAPGLWELVAHQMNSLCRGILVARESGRLDGQLGLGKFGFVSQLVAGTKRVPRYVRRARAIFDEPGRYQRVLENIQDIRAVVAQGHSKMVTDHTPEDHRFKDAELYVNRTVVRRGRSSDPNRSVVVDLGAVIDPAARAQVVIVGNPGVGKSTLVRHHLYLLAKEERYQVAPLIVRCRKYLADDWQNPIIDHIAARLSVDHSLEIDRNDLEDVLNVGAACVVFDGVDEVLEVPVRRELIKRIEQFSERFSGVSVVATSRRVGYEQARFTGVIPVFDLQEFSADQVIEYVTKWFRLTRRDEGVAQAFIRESEAVSDIRQNPLLLSLLCALFQARGYIPRNRRRVYNECADLLFSRWDEMREISQPYEHRQHAEHLMQELALFSYSYQSTQSGVDRDQLVGILATFFRDSSDVRPPDDRKRAGQFLDFCSGRAWLLSADGGNKHGVQTFSFVHRTFMEFFAAEAIVRRADRIEDVSAEVWKIMERDPISVMAEVMVQAAEARTNRGAERVLLQLFKTGHSRKSAASDEYLALCLRVINSAPMSRRVTEELPRQLEHYWGEIGAEHESRRSSLALFALSRDVRTRLEESFYDESGQPTRLGVGAAARWSMCIPDEFESAWNEAMVGLQKAVAKGYVSPRGDGRKRTRVRGGSRERRAIPSAELLVLDSAIDGGHIDPDRLPEAVQLKVPMIASPGFETARLGSGLQAMRRLLFSDQQVSESDLNILRILSRRIRRNSLCTEGELKTASTASSKLAGMELRHPASRGVDRKKLSEVAPVVMWCLLAQHETGGEALYESNLRHVFSEFCPLAEIEALAEHRRAIRFDSSITPVSGRSDVHKPLFQAVGYWAARWFNGSNLGVRA